MFSLPCSGVFFSNQKLR